MKQLKTLVFALLPLVLMSGMATAQERAGQTTQPGATQERQQTQPGATQQQRQPGTAQREQDRQDRGTAAQRDRDYQREGMAGMQRERLTGDRAIIQRQEMDQFRADNLIGSAVKNQQNEEIGQISDLLLDQQGNVVGLVVGVGGFLGIGERDVALSWDAVQLTQDEDGDPIARVNVDRQTLENAPEFERDQDDRGWGTDRGQQRDQQQRQQQQRGEQQRGGQTW